MLCAEQFLLARSLPWQYRPPLAGVGWLQLRRLNWRQSVVQELQPAQAAQLAQPAQPAPIYQAPARQQSFIERVRTAPSNPDVGIQWILSPYPSILCKLDTLFGLFNVTD